MSAVCVSNPNNLRASLIRQHLVKPPAACAPTRVEKRGDVWHIVPSIVPFVDGKDNLS